MAIHRKIVIVSIPQETLCAACTSFTVRLKAGYWSQASWAWQKNVIFIRLIMLHCSHCPKTFLSCSLRLIIELSMYMHCCQMNNCFWFSVTWNFSYPWKKSVFKVKINCQVKLSEEIHAGVRLFCQLMALRLNQHLYCMEASQCVYITA